MPFGSDVPQFERAVGFRRLHHDSRSDSLLDVMRVPPSLSREGGGSCPLTGFTRGLTAL
jgi:hypothetical protein